MQELALAFSVVAFLASGLALSISLFSAKEVLRLKETHTRHLKVVSNSLEELTKLNETRIKEVREVNDLINSQK